MNDLKPFKHGQEGTHVACLYRLVREGSQTKCCFCVPHDNCEMNKEEKFEIHCRICMNWDCKGDCSCHK